MDVDLELSLVVDVSGSVSTSEFNLQRQGYVDAFNSTVIQDAILGGPLQRIAVNLIYFGSNATEAIEFSLIDSVASAQSFATAIAAAPRSEAGSTGIGNGINLAASTLADNDFNGTRSVIDVSGDGTNNTGAPVTAARDDACGGGVDAINAIAIGSTSLETYYDSNVVCGANGFSLFAADFAGFSSAIATKLEAEIRNEDPGVVPLPVPAALLLTGLGGLGLIRRRK